MIFGGWHPVKVVIGAYLFSFLQVLGIYLQGWVPSVPAQVFQVAPFPLMIFTLLLMSLAQRESIWQMAARKPWLRPDQSAFRRRTNGPGQTLQPGLEACQEICFRQSCQYQMRGCSLQPIRKNIGRPCKCIKTTT